MNDPMLTVRIRESSWNGIVNGIEKWAGRSRDDIEILDFYFVPTEPCFCEGCADHEFCHDARDRKDGLCTVCSLARSVEKGWQKILKGEAKQQEKEDEL